MKYLKDEFRPKGPEDVSLYTVAIGEIDPFLVGRRAKQQNDALNYIQNLEGFVGFHPVPGRGTLCLFREKNQAVRARNLIKAEGCPVGDNVCECFVPQAELEKYGKKA